ncbi:unconventional myosin-XVIIIa-like isoform X2 [Acanthaster planci]|uniref:Unconventional myosin-XVIIIa-like isoform X2 n=1 Tax=Acanthaster planci TaxID=133434 RepID=A0A8B7XZY6_ACAPL|nr:unconventional myosin-XVIIIa-like isoform X2 [Acanthaster planci]
MFHFKKKDRDSKKDSKKEKKERDKQEKHSFKQKDRHKEKSMTEEELSRLDEIKRGLFPGRKISITKQQSAKSDRTDGYHAPGVEIRNSESNYSMEFTSGSDEASANSVRSSLEFPVSQMVDEDGDKAVDVNGKMEQTEQPPFVKKGSGSKKSILKGKSSYGLPDVSAGTVSTKLDDMGILADNTAYNELIAEKTRSSSLRSGSQFDEIYLEPIVHSPGPGEKTFDVDLPLPDIVVPKPPRKRDVVLQRQPNGGFGFTLRRCIIEERGGLGGAITRRTVHFAEPSATQKDNTSGLLPGDRLVEVNTENVESTPRDDIIAKIRGSTDTVSLKVQPIPELIELSHRHGVDGSEMNLEDQILKTGSLAQSSSLRIERDRYHNDFCSLHDAAKSDAQLDSEKAWLGAEKVWLLHKAGFTAAQLLKDEGIVPLAEGRIRVKLVHSDDALEVDEEDVEKANPPQYDRAEDLASLLHLNESGVLHTLRQRYGASLIHTYAGRNLVVINPMHQLSVYSDKVIQLFKGCKPEDMPPHIYATAQTAYRNMLATQLDQSVVFLGRSGGGKSWNARHTLQYLTQVAGTVSNMVTVDKIQAVATLVDAFGGARTVQNTSATRCSQILSLDFDHMGQIAAGSLQILVLEKYRVVRRPASERSFNIFYSLMGGADETLTKELFLNHLAPDNVYISPLQRSEEKQPTTTAWNKVLHACSVLGFSSEHCKALWCVLAAIIHLGAAGATKGSGSSKAQFRKPTEAQKAAHLLGISLEELAKNTFSPRLGGNAPRGSLRPVVNDPSEQGATPRDALESMMVGLYGELVNAVVSLINKALSSSYRTVSSILVVDVPGFQNPTACGQPGGASFHDLCMNYAQERLQLLFHDAMFTAQQDKYAQENIDCQFEQADTTPEAMVNLLDKQQGLMRSSNLDLRDVDQKGLLWLLDEESIFPGATDESFMERITIHYGHLARKKDGLLRGCKDKNNFILNHFQGTTPIQYNATGWLRSCREHPVVRMAIVVLQESQKNNISGLFVSLAGSLPSTMVGSVAGIEGSSSLRRASSIRRAWSSGTAAIKRKSICLQVKFQVDGIVDSLRRTRLHFVHCLLPQVNAGLCELKNLGAKSPTSPTPTSDGLIDVPYLRNQIRGLEILESTKLHKYGFPESMLFTEFRRRFEVLAPATAKVSEPVLDERKAIEELLKHCDLGVSMYRLGLSQIFFKPGALVKLEDHRDERLAKTITEFQSYCRGYLGRKQFKQLKIQHLAITAIQRNVRKFLAVRTWPWWRLVTKVLPLLDVHRTEEELKMKDHELTELRLRVEKLEKERNVLKHNHDKMEARLAEMSADLTEEHTTANHASEMLERETAERLRLEKELKELKVAHGNLQRKAERLDMEVMESRMMRSSYMDGDMGSSDEEEDSIYRSKYEQARREIELTKKRLKQEHEEEIESMKAAKKAQDRRLAEAVEEVEEERKQVGVLKRKVQKLTGEAQDTRLHLESQQARNSELEKKQRKFDAELHKVQQDLHTEHLVKERLQREKEALQSDNYILRQELEDIRSDVGIKEKRIEELRCEMSDLSSHGSKEVTEVAAIKRQKRELEAKIEDQEEELDEQAGKILQLEQSKLRLEMQLEKQKQASQKELEAKDEEVEASRSTFQNRLKQLENQIEEDYKERQSLMRQKRDLEHKLAELQEHPRASDRDTERRLRKDLKKTKALLNDAQVMLERQKASAPSSSKIKQLKNELEDSQYATMAAVKARQSMENELAELQNQLEDVSRAKAEADEKISQLNREKNDVQTRQEDQEEDFNDLLKKHKALVLQSSNDQARVNDYIVQISDLTQDKHDLEEKVSEIQSKMEFMTSTMVDRTQLARLEGRVRDLDSRLALEKTTRQKYENQAEKLKENIEKMSSEHDHMSHKDQKMQETVRRLQRELRELKEEQTDRQRRETEANKKKLELEETVDTLEESNNKLQSDLKLAFKRIADLQHALQDNDDSESDFGSTESDSDDMPEYSRRYSRYSSRSYRDSTSSLESTPRLARRRVLSSASEDAAPRKAKYTVNPASSDEEEFEPRSTSRPSSMYSEDSKGSKDSGGDLLASSSSPPAGEDRDSTLTSSTGTKKKGFVVNPDYL